MDNKTTEVKTMRTTVDKYNKLRDMELMNASKYDINARVSIIIQEVQQLLQKYEDEARAIFYPESVKENK